MARPIKRFAAPDFEPAAAAPLPFLPFNSAELYTDAELAKKLKISARTYKRWRARGVAAPTAEFNDQTHRTLGHAANLMWQARLKIQTA
jgi:hypothetical protein